MSVIGMEFHTPALALGPPSISQSSRIVGNSRNSDGWGLHTVISYAVFCLKKKVAVGSIPLENPVREDPRATEIAREPPIMPGRTRIGLLVPSNNPTVDRDFNFALPPTASVHSHHLWSDIDPRRPARSEKLGDEFLQAA